MASTTLALCEPRQGFSIILNPWGKGTFSKLPGALFTLDAKYTFCPEHFTSNYPLHLYLIIFILF